MAFNFYGLKRFSDGGIVGSGPGSVKSLCHYAHPTDDHAAVTTSNYFNAAVSVLPVGSIIFASLALDSAPVLRTYIVTANNGVAVTIAEQTVTHPE